MYRTLSSCVADLEKHGHLVRLDEPIDPHLEAAEIQRRVYLSGGPAVLFANVRDCRFPMVSNLFGTLERSRFLFRDTLETVKRLIELKIDAGQIFRRPTRYWKAPWAAISMLPRRCSRAPVFAHQIAVSQLPQLKCWPDDGGAFITLPQVYSEHVDHPGLGSSNLGMYRVQISGGNYEPDREVGLHYQIHRGIGVHHEAAVRAGAPFRVNITVGGTPAMTLAAVMPLPEGMSELGFAGALAGHRIPMSRDAQLADAKLAGGGLGLPVYAEADFCIQGVVEPARQLPEGPFGDHLGYYAGVHDFPVLRVERVTHRDGAIWPFTVVGRPPQEDTSFGELIHEITGPIIPTVIPGVRAVHAVDAAGVHPLMLAIGSERYTPYAKLSQPQELLTQANAILGQGQMSLAKYLLIVNHGDDPKLAIDDIEAFLCHLLERVDWRRDLHFQTRTTMDTLDYSARGLNEGSKVVIAAAGERRRTLPEAVPADLRLPDRFRDARWRAPGVLVVSGPEFGSEPEAVERLCRELQGNQTGKHRTGGNQTGGNLTGGAGFPLVAVVDDATFSSASQNNFLWTVFTRSDPAADIYGVDAFVEQKHWGCRGSLVVDARIKPHHAAPLIEDPEVVKKVDALAARGGPLARYL